MVETYSSTGIERLYHWTCSRLMMSCQFCSIARGSIPAQVLYESDLAMSFLDYRPIAKGHALVISKKHFGGLYDIDDETLYEVLRIARIVSVRINEIYRPLGINLVQNNGCYAGQTVFHFHIHIIPRYDGEYNKMLITAAKRRVKIDESDLEPIASEIRSALKSK